MSYCSGGELEMTETIQQLKEDIAILQDKLQKLEESEYKMTLKKTGDCDMVSYDHKYYFRLSFGVGDYYWYKRYIGSCNLMRVEDPKEHRLVEQFYEDTILDTGGIVENPDAYEETVSKYQPTPQTPESNEWRTVALRFGENLCDIGPYGYYAMTADEWLEWAKSAYEKIVSEWLQLMHKEKTKKIMNKVKTLQENDWTYKVTDEKGETNPYKQYLNNVDKKEYPYKKYTPEETEKSLKDAMKTAQSEGVFDEPETLTLKQLLKKWEFDFSAKWENPKNRTSELYEEEVERFIQMFTEWMPDANKEYDDSNWEHGWNTGYNAYRNNLMRKLK